MKFKRIIVIVMDSLGVGYADDAYLYDDAGANTFKHIYEHSDGICMPNLEKLGFLNFIGIKDIQNKNVFYTTLAPKCVGKDTMAGHFELMGLLVTTPFVTFTDTGFPQDLIDEIEKMTGRKVIGNKSASGTEIIKEYGEHQMKTGDLIVYTSADSVLQIAAHEEIIPLDELYDICGKVRQLTLKDEWKVGRIIARPYIGDSKESFKRTANRHDYALKPHGPTVLNFLKESGEKEESGLKVISVGKIFDIFDGEGITDSYPTKSNKDGMNKTIELLKGDSFGLKKDFLGLVFVNLVDFDALYGHRRDPLGYRKCIEEFDVQLGELLNILTKAY